MHGLEQGKRLEEMSLDVSNELLRECVEWQSRAEAERLALQGPKRLAVPVRGDAVELDGKLDEWADADWAMIDQRGTAAYFNSDSKPYDVRAALRVSGDKLYVAWRSTEDDLLANSGEIDIAPFKTGGGLDLMIGTDPSADGDRVEPVRGDQRLFITQHSRGPKQGELWAVHFQDEVPGTRPSDRIAFISPVHTIYMDAVTNVSDQIELARHEGNYEAAIPLSLLGLEPKAGLSLRGDVGVLRGTPGSTRQRVYWSNKATGITADVPSEARLQPKLWGTFNFE